MKIEVKDSKIQGKGVFAKEDIIEGEFIEACPVIIFSNKETELLDKTFLYNYYFSWDDDTCIIALGYGSIYNHSYNPNAKIDEDSSNTDLIIKSIKKINKGDEITINYMGEGSGDKVWFEVKN